MTTYSVPASRTPGYDDGTYLNASVDVKVAGRDIPENGYYSSFSAQPPAPGVVHLVAIGADWAEGSHDDGDPAPNAGAVVGLTPDEAAQLAAVLMAAARAAKKTERAAEKGALP